MREILTKTSASVDSGGEMAASFSWRTGMVNSISARPSLLTAAARRKRYPRPDTTGQAPEDYRSR